MKTNLPPDIKIIIVPLASLLALFVLGYLLLNLGLVKILAQGKEISSLDKEVAQLGEKNTILSEVTPTIAQNANLFSFALPSEDPAPMVFSQLKSLAASTGVSINSLSSRPSAKTSTVPEINVGVNISGTSTALFNYMTELDTITPLVVINSVIFGPDKTGNVSADIALSAFWSDFPSSIPASNEPITDLTVDEKNVISQMAAYKVPAFTELTPVGPSSLRSSPFGN